MTISRFVAVATSLVAAMITAQPLAGQHASRSMAADFAFGIATTHGPEIAKSSAVAFDVSFVRTSKRFARIGGAMGLRTDPVNGDECVFDNAKQRCLPNLAGHVEIVGLGGLGFSDGGGELRLLAGPLLVAGDGVPVFGGAVVADGAVGSETVAFTIGARASVAHRSRGGSLRSEQWTLGIRFRY